MPRKGVRFLRRGRIVERCDFPPTETLLDYLRTRERACGTKEGCAEGDCGACSVAVGRLDGDGRVTYQPVNSCILLLGTIDGAEIVTVEDLAHSNGRLHPVQRALVDSHASQCGFCTPGFVMSLFTLYHAGMRADRATVNDWLAGNLCRCTGYRPIADAALASCTGEADDAFSKRAGETAGLLAGLADDNDLFAGNDEAFFAAPASEDALATLCARYPDATIVGGATDVGLHVVEEREHQTHRHGVHAVEAADRADQRVEFRFVEGGDDLALGIDPLGDLEPPAAGDEHRGSVLEEVVEVRASGAPELQHVAKSAGGDERDAGALRLEQGIGDDSCGVREERDRFGRDAVFVHRGAGALDHGRPEVVRGRRHLGDPHPAARLVENRHVCERPADIDPDTPSHRVAPVLAV